jgi:carbon storage regulator
MLVLSRRPGQSILIGKDIEIVVLGSDGVQVRVGIRAPREVTVLRRELLKQVEEENRRASTGTVGVSMESLGAALGQLGGALVGSPLMGGPLNGGGLPAPPPVPSGAEPPAEPRKVRRAGAA